MSIRWRYIPALPSRGACPLRRVLIFLAVPAVLAAQHPAPSAADWAKARRVLSTTPLIDSHNDLPWVIRERGKPPMDVDAYDLRKPTPGHTDFARMKAGMLGAQFWSVYLPGDITDSGFA